MAKKKNWKEAETELEGIPVATSEAIPGYTIKAYKGYVWGTTVKARFIGHDIIAAVKMLIGGEIDQYTNMINEAKLEAVHKMVKNAKALDANAVISVRAGTAQVLPGTVEIFCYGTAVEVIPE
ncbi:YbjQ family protein [archaeon]|nr:YbjQ family protein [archaeon]